MLSITTRNHQHERNSHRSLPVGYVLTAVIPCFIRKGVLVARVADLVNVHKEEIDGSNN